MSINRVGPLAPLVAQVVRELDEEKKEELPAEAPPPPALLPSLGERILNAARAVLSMVYRAPSAEPAPAYEERENRKIDEILERMVYDPPETDDGGKVDRHAFEVETAKTLERIFMLAPGSSPELSFQDVLYYLKIVFENDQQTTHVLNTCNPANGYPRLEAPLLLQQNWNALRAYLQRLLSEQLSGLNENMNEVPPQVYALLAALELAGCDLQHVLDAAVSLAVSSRPADQSVSNMRGFSEARSLIAAIVKKMLQQPGGCDFSTPAFRGQTCLEFYQSNPLGQNRHSNSKILSAHEDIVMMLSLPNVDPV